MDNKKVTMNYKSGKHKMHEANFRDRKQVKHTQMIVI